MRIGFIGNFLPPHSTENDRAWSFRQLGHHVVELQENKTQPGELLSYMRDVDMLMYSHTHDPAYVIPNLIDVLRQYREAGVPTASAHLDRWLWLQRVRDVGHEATWFTEHVFMADCSPEAVELYDRLGLNWHYLQPGVIARDCYLAPPNHDRFPHDIVFVGSKGYHPEYPFRPKLIDWLHATYGDRFGHYGGGGIRNLRSHDLNVCLASAKIVVGDSCFGGRPNYVSDRYYETRGRGGFLLHPRVPGVDYHGIGHYEAENLDSLADTIDYWLHHDEERERYRRIGFEWVRDHETYTQRAQTILDTVFG